jgi:hypothetical protein
MEIGMNKINPILSKFTFMEKTENVIHFKDMYSFHVMFNEELMSLWREIETDVLDRLFYGQRLSPSTWT